MYEMHQKLDEMIIQYKREQTKLKKSLQSLEENSTKQKEGYKSLITKLEIDLQNEK